MPEIEILRSPGCGNADIAAERAREVAAALAPDAVVVVRDITRDPQATARFAGSPTVLVDGRDVGPGVEPAPSAG